jgi:hypothetical protein
MAAARPRCGILPDTPLNETKGPGALQYRFAVAAWFSALRVARAQVQSCSARRPTADSRIHGFTIKDIF